MGAACAPSVLLLNGGGGRTRTCNEAQLVAVFYRYSNYSSLVRSVLTTYSFVNSFPESLLNGAHSRYTLVIRLEVRRLYRSDQSSSTN